MRSSTSNTEALSTSSSSLPVAVAVVVVVVVVAVVVAIAAGLFGEPVNGRLGEVGGVERRNTSLAVCQAHYCPHFQP